MPPSTGYDPIGTVQQAIVALLNANEPLFIDTGLRLFTSFAGILVAWYGIRWMFGAGGDEERLFGLAKLLLVIAFGYAMINFYKSPIPGLGSSFSNLITDQAGYLASVISARSVQNAQETLNTLWNALEQPDPWSILANLLYWTLLVVIALAQFAVLFVVSFGMIASAVCALLGPLFIPFFIVPTLEWLFWSWLKAFIQYLLHAGGRQRIHFRLRALSQSIPANTAASTPARGPAPLRRARRDDPHHFCVWRPARSFPDQFHLFRPIGRISAARPRLVVTPCPTTHVLTLDRQSPQWPSATYPRWTMRAVSMSSSSAQRS